VRQTTATDGETFMHIRAPEQPHVRRDIQQIMEGGVAAFVRWEKRYNNELNSYPGDATGYERGPRASSDHLGFHSVSDEERV
jgi:hypothetical protein